jgi:hemerythrin
MMKRHLWKLEWDEGMSVGIPEIDDDHKQFIMLISELNRAIAERMRPAEVHRRLQMIVDDTKRHFEREEQFFLKWQYPGARDHAHVHAQILKSLQNILESFLPYGLEAEWTDAALVVKDLLINHILIEDMKYAHHLQVEASRASSHDNPDDTGGGKQN